MSSQPTSEGPVRITVSPSALPRPQERSAAGSGSRAWWGMEGGDFAVGWQLLLFRGGGGNDGLLPTRSPVAAHAGPDW